MASDWTRRKWIVAAAAGGAAAALGDMPGAATATIPGTTSAQMDTPLRFVHLTDMHVSAERAGDEGFAAALRAVKELDVPPSFIITGGDHVFEALDRPRASVVDQWKRYRKTLAEGTSLKVYPVLGNHDIWGWCAKDGLLKGDEAGYGKAMALDELGLKRPYYTFDAGAWRFIVLDSMTRRKNGYFAEIDELQLQWLRQELAAVPKGRHVCVVSHIPILAACVFFDGDRLVPAAWSVPDAWMHRDAATLAGLLHAHNVRLAISGHIHLLDRVEYNGVTFVCDGAISGNWWKGPYHETPAGFGVFDMYPDGRVAHRYVDFGWKPRAG